MRLDRRSGPEKLSPRAALPHCYRNSLDWMVTVDRIFIGTKSAGRKYSLAAARCMPRRRSRRGFRIMSRVRF
jgi:hypothetical protein